MDRVLKALQAQTLPREDWELLLIDNASEDRLRGRFSVEWHPNARHVREGQLGLTLARVRGIREASGDLLVFVDDDNVLANDYLETTLRVADQWPILGAWGGTIAPEFESVPPSWTKPHWAILAVREIAGVRWSNNPDDWHSLPCGAGLSVRKSVANKYLEQVTSDRLRRGLGRVGSSLLSTEDTDLVRTSACLGLGWGLFSDLSIIHLIPARRLTEDYLVRLTEGMSASKTALALRRGKSVAVHKGWRKWLRWLVIYVRRGRRGARFFLAETRGRATGEKMLVSIRVHDGSD